MTLQTTKIGFPDRLERLAALLDRDAVDPTGAKFDLSTWAAPAEDRRSAVGFDEELDVVPVSCGTRACAFGLAAISGEFKEEGLSYTYQLSSGYDRPQYMLIPTMPGELHPYSGFDAALRLFGIEIGAAYYLFDPSHYDSCPVGAKGEKEVSERIREFIATSEYDDGDDYEEPEDDDEEPNDND